MKITGELLKSERTRKNLSIQDVAFALKLSSKIITSIEAGDTEGLPAKTFIRGFVKSYAQYLKIDVDQVMRQFQEEMGSTHPLPKGPALSGSSAQSSEPSSMRVSLDGETKKTTSTAPTEQAKVLNEHKSGRSLIYIGIAVVLVILIVAVNRFADRYRKESVLNPQDISKVQPLDPNQQSVPTSSATMNAPTAASVTSDTNTTTASTAPVAVATPSSDSSTAQPAVSQPAQSTPVNSASTQSSTGDLEDGFEPSSGKPVEIVLEAKKDIEILYARGNTKTFSKLKLSAKQVQVIRSTTGLHLKAEDGGAFNMVVNGIDKGQAGPSNKPVRFSF